LLLFELDDYFGELAELSTLPPQIIATEPMTGKSSEAAHETDGVTGSGENNREEAPVGAIQPSDDTASVQSANWWDDKLSFEETSELSPASAQIVTPAPTIENDGQASNEADSVAIAGSEAADVPVGAIRRSDEMAIVERSTLSDKPVIVDETADVPVGRIEPRHESATTAWSPTEDKITLGEVLQYREGLPQAF